MLGKSEIYRQMAEVEKDLWWYKTLHYSTARNIQKVFGQRKDIQIVDAACGTGGLLNYLQNRGYKNISGFDLSDDAIRICHEKGFEVDKLSLLDIRKKFQPASVDVVICNDAIIYLSKKEQKDFIDSVHSILSDGGVGIMNVPAGALFYGLNDISFELKERFNKTKLKNLIQKTSLHLVYSEYWPFLLSPVIMIIRLWQRILFFIKPKMKVRPDIQPVHPVLNNVLYQICWFEIRSFPFKVWGSSLMFVFRK